MPAYLLTWNPRRFEKDWSDEVRRLRIGERVQGVWSTGVNKSILPGDSLYFLRLGSEPRGVFATGIAVSEVYQAPHWSLERAEDGDLANYIRYELEAVLDPEREAILDPRVVPDLRESNWSLQGSGHRLKDEYWAPLETAWKKHLRAYGSQAMKSLNSPTVSEFDDWDADLDEMPEGEIRRRYIIHREREKRLREEKLRRTLAQHGRIACEVPGCGFDFHETYGELGRRYAHVHHLKPLASRAEPESTRLDELVIVCANCHAMIHRGGENRPVESLIPGKR